MESEYPKLPSMPPYGKIPPPAPEALESVQHLHDRVAEAFPSITSNFAEKYDIWKKTWHEGRNVFSNNSSSRAEGPEFEDLEDLGPMIVPLVAQRLTAYGDFFTVELYNILEDNKQYLVNPNDLLNHNVLQRQASLIVELSHNRIKTTQSLLAGWKGWQELHPHPENSIAKSLLAGCEEYDSLLQIGSSIFLHVMLEYKQDQSVWWHELLCHLQSGKHSERVEYSKADLYQQWQSWWENSCQGDTPY